MENLLHFYQSPGPYTDPQEFRPLLKALPDDPEAIIRFIKQLLIHPLEAKNQQVRFDLKKALRRQADHRSVDDILINPKVHALLERHSLDLESTPQQRAILSCDHHAVLFASIVRLKGLAVRLRCGYATYLIPGKLTPHWICEVPEEAKRQWKYVDSEQARLNVLRDEFHMAGKIWLDARHGSLPLAQILPDYRNGLDGIKYRLLNDMNALMKNELLHYEWMIKEAKPKAPELFAKPVSKLDEAQCDLLDELATASLDTDGNWETLLRRYALYVRPENLHSGPT